MFGPTGCSQVLDVDSSLIHRWDVPPSTWPLPSSDGRTDRSHPWSVCPHGRSCGHHHGDGAAGGDVPDVAGANCVSALPAGHRHLHLPPRGAHEHAVLPLLLLRGVSGDRIQLEADVGKHVTAAANRVSALSSSGATSAAAWFPAWSTTSRMWCTPAPTARATSTRTSASANHRQPDVGEISPSLPVETDSPPPPHICSVVQSSFLSVWLLSLVTGIFHVQKYILALFFHVLTCCTVGSRSRPRGCWAQTCRRTRSETQTLVSLRSGGSWRKLWNTSVFETICEFCYIFGLLGSYT